MYKTLKRLKHIMETVRELNALILILIGNLRTLSEYLEPPKKIVDEFKGE